MLGPFGALAEAPMMASALLVMSSLDVAQPQMLIRMAGRCSHTVGPHHHVPSFWTASTRASVRRCRAHSTTAGKGSNARRPAHPSQHGSAPGASGYLSQQRLDVSAGKLKT